MDGLPGMWRDLAFVLLSLLFIGINSKESTFGFVFSVACRLLPLDWIAVPFCCSLLPIAYGLIFCVLRGYGICF